MLAEMRTPVAFLLAAAALALQACSSTPTAPAAAPVAAAPATPAARPAPSAPGTPVAPQRAALAPHLDPASALSRENTVFFEFDEMVLDREDQRIVELHGRYLATHPDLRIAVQGHADERGSTEYNLALGQRRAQAVKDALRVLGVKEGQVEATSYGEEKPLAQGSDEAAWSKNRRAAIVYR
jgi:peptidoglycan-associated lipoprotein